MHPYFFPLGEASSLFSCFFLIVIDLVFCLAELDSFYLNGPSSQLGLVPIYPGVKCVRKQIPQDESIPSQTGEVKSQSDHLTLMVNFKPATMIDFANAVLSAIHIMHHEWFWQFSSPYL
jgi:hypothetical protein